MPDWFAIALGIAIGAALLAGAVWWSFRLGPANAPSLLPEALSDRPEPDPNVIAAAGFDSTSGSGHDH